MDIDLTVVFSVICLGLMIVSTGTVGIHIFWKEDMKKINEGVSSK